MGALSEAEQQLAGLPTGPVGLRPDLVATFEREGLLGALESVAEVLDGHGLEKHGVQRWRQLSWLQLAEKFERHRGSVGREKESGHLHGAHAVTRLLMLLQLEIENGR